MEKEIEDLKEIEKIFEKTKLKEQKKMVNIIYDKTQHSIRIPKKFVEIMEIDSIRDKFEFEIKDIKGNPILTGKFIKND